MTDALMGAWVAATTVHVVGRLMSFGYSTVVIATTINILASLGR